MKRIYSELLCAALIGAFVSCTPDDEFIRSNGQMESLRFSVGVADDNDASTTRSESYVVDTFVLDGDTLSLVCTVTDMDTPAPEAEETSATRGVPIYSRPGTGGSSLFNLQTVYGKFNVSGYIVDDDNDKLDPFYYNYAKDGKTYMGSDVATPGEDEMYVNIPYTWESYENTSSSIWEYWVPADASATDSKSGKFYWWRDKVNAENNYKLQFFAYSPTTDVTAYPWDPDNMKNSYGGITTFDYEVPVSSTTPKTDAEKQPDILVGATEAYVRDDLNSSMITIGTEKHYVVPLKFYHALCGVRFKATEELATNEHGLVINSITLSGLKSEGTCTFNLGATGGTKSADKISWAFATGSANDGSYTQEFGYTVPETTGTNEFNDAEGQKDATIYGAEEGAGANKNFMLIPQSFGTATGVDSPGATISIKYTYNGVTKTKDTPLFQKNPSSTVTSYAWQAGKLYTYEIKKIADEIDVAVVETFNASTKTKTDVNAKNTGTRNEYLRAAVIANWVDGYGSVIAPLDFTSVGTGKQLASFSGISTSWVHGSDGFYYYPKIVEPNKQPKEKLFTSLVAGKSPAEDTGAHLVVTVIVQGLEAGSSSTDYATKKNTAESTWGIGTSILTTDKDE